MKKVEREKKWIGGLIAGLLSLAGGVTSAVMSKKNTDSQIEEYKKQIDATNKYNNNIASANVLSGMQNLYSNDYLSNGYYNRFSNVNNINSTNQSTLKCGGKKRIKRKKSGFGSFMTDYGNGIISSVPGLITTVSGAINNNRLNKAMSELNDARTNNNTEYTFSGYTEDTYSGKRFNDRFYTYKCGGRKKRK